MLRIFVVLLVVVFPESHQNCLYGHYTPPTQDEVDMWNHIQAEFAVDLFKILADANKRNNLVISPFNVYKTVMLVYFGAFRHTEVALKRTLRIPGPTTRNQSWNYYQYDEHLFRNINPGYTMKSVEKIYFSMKYRLTQCLTAMFGDKLEKISGSAVSIVNNWLKKISNGLIVNALDTLHPTTPVSATYFKENWEIGFRTESVTKWDFQVRPNRRVKVNVMYDLHAYETGYSKDLEAFMIILPFKGRDSAMILLLPEVQRDGDVNDMIKKLDIDAISYVTNRSKYKAEQVSIVMPTFTTKKRIDMKDALNKMGALDSFVGTADFSRFTGRKEIFMDSLVHHAAIQVVAEYAQSDPLFDRMGETSRFHCNRPFVYLVVDFSKCRLLMMGVYRRPEKHNRVKNFANVRSDLQCYKNYSATAI